MYSKKKLLRNHPIILNIIPPFSAFRAVLLKLWWRLTQNCDDSCRSFCVEICMPLCLRQFIVLLATHHQEIALKNWNVWDCSNNFALLCLSTKNYKLSISNKWSPPLFQENNMRLHMWLRMSGRGNYVLGTSSVYTPQSHMYCYCLFILEWTICVRVRVEMKIFEAHVLSFLCVSVVGKMNALCGFTNTVLPWWSLTRAWELNFEGILCRLRPEFYSWKFAAFSTLKYISPERHVMWESINCMIQGRVVRLYHNVLHPCPTGPSPTRTRIGRNKHSRQFDVDDDTMKINNMLTLISKNWEEKTPHKTVGGVAEILGKM